MNKFTFLPGLKNMVELWVLQLVENRAFRYFFYTVVSLWLLKNFFVWLRNFFRGRYIHLVLRFLPREYKKFSGILIRSEEGLYLIDHLVVSKYGVFVLDVRSYGGWISGREKHSLWVQNIQGDKFYFDNPLFENLDRIEKLREIDGMDYVKFISLVVFSSKAVLKNAQDNVIYAKDLRRWITSYKEEVHSQKEVESIYKIIKGRNIANPAARKKYYESLESDLKPWPVK